MKKTRSRYAIIKKSNIHNKGMFATKNIMKGTKIIEYVGNKLTKKQAEIRADEMVAANEKNPSKGAVYLFELNKRYDIDGDVPWNTARFINHSCDPNCETEIKEGHIWIESVRGIKKGEEILYNYGYDLDVFEDHPCKCGTSKCVGYIVSEDEWPKLKIKLNKKAKNKHKK